LCRGILLRGGLDNDANGGVLDAFRHAYWMARLAQEMSWRKAYSLGLAHEKTNRRNFKKKIKEDGSVQDSVSCWMDINNNMFGISIGISKKDASKEELIREIIENINKGSFLVIRKNDKGESLDCFGNIINDEEWKSKWNNRRCLVPSNYKRIYKMDDL